MTEELVTIVDLIRYAASRFNAAGLTFGHSHDNAIDEATHLVLSTLHLPPDLPPAYGGARVTADEKRELLALLERRIETREPVAYLVGEAWFAGMPFKSDPRALVPRSPIAELIEGGFSSWLDGREVERALDLCTGSGCIGIAMAAHNPHWRVDIADISEDALALACENIALHQLEDRVRAIHADLFTELQGGREAASARRGGRSSFAKAAYGLIVSNPPYVTDAEYAALPGEYAHEPHSGLTAGVDGLDIVLRILRDAPEHLTDEGLLIVEVGMSERALTALLPEVPFVWIEFKVGPMGVFALARRDLVAHAKAIRAAADAR